MYATYSSDLTIVLNSKANHIVGKVLYNYNIFIYKTFILIIRIKISVGKYNKII